MFHTVCMYRRQAIERIVGLISFFPPLFRHKGWGNNALHWVKTLSYELALLNSMKISLGIPITKNFMETYRDEFFFLLVEGVRG
jgi:hypothetical protein